MIANESQLKELLGDNLPPGAEILTIDRPKPHAAILTADLDGDGMPELAAGYRSQGQVYVVVLKKRDQVWEAVTHLTGPGYGITELLAAPVTGRGRPNLTVGWQIGAIWSNLSIYNWTETGLQDAAPSDMSYSYLDIEDMPSRSGRDDAAELALWIHDTGDAYKVDVVRWGNGRFVDAVDVYPYYYRKVSAYYERLVRLHPDYAIYWYYLADAQMKSGMREAALVSVEKALSLNAPHPSKDRLLELQSMLQPLSGMRAAALFPASLKTKDGVKWGYIDGQGRLVIPAQFEYAFEFQDNGLATVQVRGRNGLIDTSGHYVVQPVYDSISPFSEGRSIVIDSQGFKVMDETGRILTRKAYPFIAPYREGRAYFYVEGGGESGTYRYGYLDLAGNEVIPPRFEGAGDFSQGKAVVKAKDNEYAMIGLNGETLMTYPYAFVGPLGDGLMAFQRTSSDKYGYIDEKGDVAIEPAYTGALPFQEGRAVVNTAEDFNNRYGLINKQGKFAIPPEYNEIRQLGEERIAAGKPIDPKRPYIGSVFAIADLNGRFLSEFRYNDVSDFHNGLASASDRKLTFFIDRSGKPAPGYPRLNGSGTLTMMDGIIQANIDQRISYLDRAGRVIWKQNTVIPLNPPYRVKEEKYKPNKDYLVYYPQLEGMQNAAAQKKVNFRLKDMSVVKSIPADKQLDSTYTGDFEVAFYKKDLVELLLTGYNYPFGAAHGMPSKVYAHIDLKNGRLYELKDLFKPGSDYVKVLSGIVGKQIKEDPQYSYVFEGSYKGIRPDQPFYVTERALHLYFYPYEIAPYAAGFPTFTIPFAEIMDIIAVDGPFWQSFH